MLAVLVVLLAPVTACSRHRDPVPTEELSWCGAVTELAEGVDDPSRLEEVSRVAAEPPHEIADEWRLIQAGHSAANSPAYTRVEDYLVEHCGRDLLDLQAG